MKALIFSDLITAKNAALSLALIMLLVGSCCLFGTEAPSASVAAMTVTLAMMYPLSTAAYDEMNGWERFRMTLPMTRTQAVCGRYLSVALVALVGMALGIAGTFALMALSGWAAGFDLPFDIPASVLPSTASLGTVVPAALAAAGCALLTAAVGLPLLLRFGLTTGTRIVPVAFIMLIAAGMITLSCTPAVEVLEAWYDQLAGSSVALLGLVCAAVVAAIYCASAALSVRLYANREL